MAELLEVDEVLLLHDGWVICLSRAIQELFRETIRVDIIAIDLIVLLIITGEVTLIFHGSIILWVLLGA